MAVGRREFTVLWPELNKYPKYSFVKLLGSGGMGRVYKGLYDGFVVAFKVTDFSHSPATFTEDVIKGEERTLKILNKAQSPNIIKLFAYSYVNREMILVLQCLDDSLADLIKMPIPPYLQLYYLNEILNGLAVIHAHNMIHLDVKPENILYSKKDGHLKICDFGLACEVNPETGCYKMSESFPIGTAYYRPPELLEREDREFTTAVDMWAFGILCIEMIKNHRPYADLTDLTHPDANINLNELIKTGAMQQVAQKQCKSLHQSLHAFIPMIRACLDPDPTKRPTAYMFSKKAQKLSRIFKFLPQQKQLTIVRTDILGQSNYSTIYPGLLTDASGEHPVACKIIKEDKFNQKILYKELEILSLLTSPYIIKFIGYKLGIDYHVQVLERLEKNLFEIVKKSSLTWDLRIRFIQHLLQGVQVIHDLNVIHTALHPEHIMIGGDGSLRIIDFTKVKSLNAAGFLDSPKIEKHYCYNSPEAITRTQVGKASDMWSLGATILFMITGQTPYSDLDLEFDFETEYALLSTTIGNFNAKNSKVSEEELQRVLTTSLLVSHIRNGTLRELTRRYCEAAEIPPEASPLIDEIENCFNLNPQARTSALGFLGTIHRMEGAKAADLLPSPFRVNAS